MNTKDEKNDKASTLFISSNQRQYEVSELIDSFNKNHCLYDFKSDFRYQSFSEQELGDLITNYPELKNVMEEYYNSHTITGLLYTLTNKEKLFEVMQKIQSALNDLREIDDWGWLSDEEISQELSAPLNELYQLSQSNNLKILERVCENDLYLNTFFCKGFNEHLKKIHNGSCSAGFAEAFSKLHAQMLTGKCYVDKELLSQKISKSEHGFFKNTENSDSKSIEPVKNKKNI